MRKYRAALFLLATLSAAAVAAAATKYDRRTFEIEGKPQVFLRIPEYNWISADCLKAGNLDCEAVRAPARASALQIPAAQFRGGANPGAVYCRGLGAFTATATDAKQNVTSFCRFADGSLITSFSLLKK